MIFSIDCQRKKNVYTCIYKLMLTAVINISINMPRQTYCEEAKLLIKKYKVSK